MTHRGARLAISNIAWLKEETDLVFDAVAGTGVTGVEIAPGTVSPSYAAGIRQDGVFSAYAKRLSDRGLQPAAIEDVLCGGGPYAFWGEDDVVTRTVEKVSMAGGAATVLQTRTIVLDAPGLRARRRDTDGGDMSGFVRFARRALRMTEHRGVSIALKPCPSIYGCEFAPSHEAAHRVAHAVMNGGAGDGQKTTGSGNPAKKKAGHGGAAPMDDIRAGVFGITFDLAAAMLEDDDVERCVMEYAPKALHFHISEPHLVRVGSCGSEHHKAAARALATLRANGSATPPWLSIEMNRAQLSTSQIVEDIRRATDFVTETYSGSFDS